MTVDTSYDLLSQDKALVHDKVVLFFFRMPFRHEINKSGLRIKATLPSPQRLKLADKTRARKFLSTKMSLYYP